MSWLCTCKWYPDLSDPVHQHTYQATAQSCCHAPTLLTFPPCPFTSHPPSPHSIRMLLAAEASPFDLFESVVTQSQAAADPALKARPETVVDDNLGFAKVRAGMATSWGVLCAQAKLFS